MNRQPGFGGDRGRPQRSLAPESADDTRPKPLPARPNLQIPGLTSRGYNPLTLNSLGCATTRSSQWVSTTWTPRDIRQSACPGLGLPALNSCRNSQFDSSQQGLNPTKRGVTGLEIFWTKPSLHLWVQIQNNANTPVDAGAATRRSNYARRTGISSVLNQTTGHLHTVVAPPHKPRRHDVWHPSETTPIKWRDGSWTKLL